MGYTSSNQRHGRAQSSRPRGDGKPAGSYGGGRRRQGGGRPGGNGGRGPKKANIANNRYINTAVAQAEEAPYEAKNRFADFPFSANLQANIAKKGYDMPSAIQDQAIPHIVEGKDIIGIANTGTGKTAAFLLPIIERQIGLNIRPSVLILAPTRELAQQIDEQFRDFASGIGLYSAILVGGANIGRQIRDLRRRPHVIIGTPGRTKDLLDRGELKLGSITTLVLDEADRMLDMGFLPDIKRVVGLLPNDRQTLFFSATMTNEIKLLTAQFLDHPVTVSVRTSDTNEHIDQGVVEYTDRDNKHMLLSNLLGSEGYDKVLIFGETKFGVQRLADKLNKEGHSATAIHGNKSQSQRQRALKSFKDEQVNILVATDVAARGLDIPAVSHVINYDTPQTYDDYIHRIGRTGRAGARGRAHTFVPKQR